MRSYTIQWASPEFLTLKKFFDTSLENLESLEQYLHKVEMLVEDLEGKNIKLPGQVVMSWVLYHLTAEYAGSATNIARDLRYSSNACSVGALFSSLLDEARVKEKDKPPKTAVAKTQSGNKEKLLFKLQAARTHVG